MTWFRPLIEPKMLDPQLLRNLVQNKYEGVEFTNELIYLLVEGRLKRAYERTVQ